jgi:FlaA1/EpsC-like NDP-sugar epimerase
VAERLAAQADRRIDIVYTGLRPGEKLHEVLVSGAEVGVTREHAMISHIQVPPLKPEAVEHATWGDAPEVVTKQLAELCLREPTISTEKVEEQRA